MVNFNTSNEIYKDYLEGMWLWEIMEKYVLSASTAREIIEEVEEYCNGLIFEE